MYSSVWRFGVCEYLKLNSNFVPHRTNPARRVAQSFLVVTQATPLRHRIERLRSSTYGRTSSCCQTRGAVIATAAPGGVWHSRARLYVHVCKYSKFTATDRLLKGPVTHVSLLVCSSPNDLGRSVARNPKTAAAALWPPRLLLCTADDSFGRHLSSKIDQEGGRAGDPDKEDKEDEQDEDEGYERDDSRAQDDADDAFSGRNPLPLKKFGQRRR